MRKDLKNNIAIFWRNHINGPGKPGSVNTLYRRRHYGTVKGIIGAEDMWQENKTSFLKPGDCGRTAVLPNDAARVRNSNSTVSLLWSLGCTLLLNNDS